MDELARRIDAHDFKFRMVLSRLDALESGLQSKALDPTNNRDLTGPHSPQLSLRDEQQSMRDDISKFSAATTGMSIPAPFTQSLIPAFAQKSELAWLRRPPVDGMGSCAGLPSSASMGADAVAAVKKLAGDEPMPWIEMLVRQGRRCSNDIEEGGDQDSGGLDTSDASSTNEPSQSTINNFVQAANGYQHLNPQMDAVLAAVLSLAAMTRDDDNVRKLLWNRTECIQAIIGLLQVSALS